MHDLFTVQMPTAGTHPFLCENCVLCTWNLTLYGMYCIWLISIHLPDLNILLPSLHLTPNYLMHQLSLTFWSPQTASSSLKPPDFFQNFGKIPQSKSIDLKACSASFMSALIWSMPFSNFSSCSPWSQTLNRNNWIHLFHRFSFWGKALGFGLR